MSLTERQRDDLLWCLKSPPLIARPGDAWPGDDWFAGLEPGECDRLPIPPHAHHFRLGRHFEKLLTAWLRSRDDMKIRFANLQVREGKRTIGSRNTN